MRATQLPTVQRLFPPIPTTLDKQVTMQSLKDKMLRKIKEFKDKRCNKHGWIKKKNIGRMESEGLDEIKDRVKKEQRWCETTYKC